MSNAPPMRMHEIGEIRGGPIPHLAPPDAWHDPEPSPLQAAVAPNPLADLVRGYQSGDISLTSALAKAYERGVESERRAGSTSR